MTSKMQEPYLKTPCNTCLSGSYQLPDNAQEWHVKCDECNSILFCYDPMPHQESFHQDPAKFKMWAGGYGSAKTSTCAAEMVVHALTTPNGTSLVGAATLPQLEQTAKKQFLEMLPHEYIVSRSEQKNYIDLINGHRVLFRPLDDEGKARSLNLTAWWVEEASEVKFEYFVQLQTRLRNHATEHHFGLLSTNPDMNWIKKEFLLKSNSIYNSDITYHQIDEEINSNFSTHIAASSLNTHLPPTYFEDTAKGKEEWWIRRYLMGSFENKEGLVYPFDDYFVEPFDIPKHWERLQATDFGLVDPTATLWGAIDPKTADIYIYDEYYKSEQTVPYHAEQMHKRISAIPPGLFRQPIGDPKGRARSEKDKRSIYDHYAEYGIYFKPGINKIEDGVMKVYTYFGLKKLKVFNNLKWFRWEIEQYKYPERKLGEEKAADEKPVDKHNHLMDCLKYLISDLPDNPFDLINQSYGTNDVLYGNISKEKHLPFALQDEDADYNESSSWVNYY